MEHLFSGPLKPEGQQDGGYVTTRLRHDFLTPRLTVIGKTWIPEPIARWFYNQAFPGMQGYIVARTRYFDDYFQQTLEDGVEQIVIVGAGYDSRAYRFAQLNAHVKIFEVDHPATQQEKMQARRERLRRSAGRCGVFAD